VVTGYQGGIWNPIGGYYTVRQSDAHAWVEVWLPGQGWTRFDPTGVVAPERLQRGSASATAANFADTGALLGEAGWLRGLRDAWEAAGGWWQEQIVNFNRARQENLLRMLGLDRIDYAGMALLLLAGGLLWALLLMALLKNREPRARQDALAKVWGRFLKLLQQRGVAIADHDGPEAIRQRAQQQIPEAAGAIDLFASDYERLRFGGGDSGDAQALAALRTRLGAIARATGYRPRQESPGYPNSSKSIA
jgi:hypothetical protein